MSTPSTITTLYTPDVPRVLSAAYRMDRADRTFIDAQVLGVQKHISDSLIRGQIGSNFQVASSSATLLPGDLICAAPETAIEDPSNGATRKVTKASSAALSAAGIVLGVAMTIGVPGSWVRAAMEGIVGPTITGLAAGAAGFVRASGAGRCERVAGLSTSDFPLGYVDGYGNLSLLRERTVTAGGGGGSGGYTTVKDEASTLTQRTTLTFTGNDVVAADTAGETVVTINGGLRPDGSRPLTADWAVGAFKISSSAAPTTGNDYTNKTYVDALALPGGAAGGQALIWSGSAWLPSTNFQAQNLTTTGAIRVGAAPYIGTGDIRGGALFSIVANNAANNAYIVIADVGNTASDVLYLGSDSYENRLRGRQVSVVQAASTGAFAMGAFKVSPGANLNFTASTEIVDVEFALNRTTQWATGALTTQRAMVVRAPTYAFVGASTLTTAVTASITGAPVAGTNATLTNRWAFMVEADDTWLKGNLALGATPASSGNIRLPYQGKIVGRNIANSGNYDVLTVGNGVNADVILGEDTLVDVARVRAASQISLYVGGAESVRCISTTTVSVYPSVLSFQNGTSQPIFRQESNPSGSGLIGQAMLINAQDMGGVGSNGAALTIRAGDASGASGTRNGGAFTLRSGTGPTADGDFTLQRGSSMQLQLVKPSSGLVIGLVRTSAVTSTQMPANTGDGVVYVGDATTAPTTGFPASGAIVYTDATQGFSVKDKLGGEVSFGTGESGNTVRRRLLEVRTPGTKVSTSATTQVNCGTFDCTSLNNQSINNATLLVRYKVVAFSSGSYHTIAEKVACISTNGAGAPTLVGAVANGNSATGGIIGTDYSAVTIDVSGNTVRGRITPATTDNYDHFGFFEIMGASQ